MKIGELAKATGVRVGTIRFYERRKLLKPAVRTASGYRAYTREDVQAIQGIRLTQELGFTLREIKELLDLHRSARQMPGPVVDGGGMRHALFMTQEKLHALDHKAQAIRRMRRELLQILRTLRSAARGACPFASRRQTGCPAASTAKKPRVS